MTTPIRRIRSNPTVAGIVLDELATVDWIEKSDVAALREGVIERMELKLGDPALADRRSATCTARPLA